MLGQQLPCLKNNLLGPSIDFCKVLNSPQRVTFIITLPLIAKKVKKQI